MADIKQHGTAAVVAALVSIGAQQAMPQKTRIVEKPVYVTIGTSKHAWPDLSDIEKAALAGKVGFLKGSKVEILCGGSDCRDLQTDLDDVFEDAGVSSERASPFNALGYGIAVIYGVGDYAHASALAAEIKAVTAGRVAPAVESAALVPIDGLVIAIGKRPR
jgi:hypothetical protein